MMMIGLGGDQLEGSFRGIVIKRFRRVRASVTTYNHVHVVGYLAKKVT